MAGRGGSKAQAAAPVAAAIETPVAPVIETQVPGTDPQTNQPANQPAGQMNAGEQPAVDPALDEWTTVRSYLSKALGTELPEDFTPQALAQEIYTGVDAREALAAKDREMAELRAKYSNSSTPAASPAAPAAPAQASAAGSGMQVPKFNPEWEHAETDDNGNIVDPVMRRDFERYRRDMAKLMPQMAEKFANIDQIIEERAKKIAEEAAKYTEERLTTASVNEQYTAFFEQTPGLLQAGPQGPIRYQDAQGRMQYRTTPDGDRVLDMVDYFKSEFGISDAKAKMAAMKFAPRPTAQSPMFVRSTQTPAAPAAPAAPSIPARRAQVPTQVRTSSAQPANRSPLDQMMEKAQQVGLR